MNYFYLFLAFFLMIACNKHKQTKPKVLKEKSTYFELLSSQDTGIDFRNEAIETTEEMNSFSFTNIYNGGGVSLGDINNDGLVDIYFTANQVDNRLYLNKGGMKFEDITMTAKVSGKNSWTTGVVMADVNGDGWLDIYVCQSGGKRSTPDQRKNLLYINNKDLTFTEAASAYGIDDAARSNHAAFFDYDKDGDLDLYVLNHPINVQDFTIARLEKSKNPNDTETDKLFRNNGNKTFTEVTNIAGVRNYGIGLSVCVSDFNKDGWPDLFIANDFSEPDYLYINNQDGTFSDNIHDSFKHISQFSMGSDAADINNDGLIDLFVLDMMAEDNKRKKTNMQGMNSELFYQNYALGRHLQYMQNMLHLNRGNQKFSEISELSGISNTDWSWAPLLCDLDNDGWKDIYITNGMRYDVRNNDITKDFGLFTLDFIIKNHKRFMAMFPSSPIDNYVYHNQKDLTFEKKNIAWNLSHQGFSNGASYADLDNDGDLDLVVNNLEDTAIIFKNNTVNTNYIQVQLKGNKQNTKAIGAKVSIKTNGNNQYAEMYVNRGFLSSTPPILHFGVGDEKHIDEILIEWVDGKKTKLESIESNQLLTIDYHRSIFIEETNHPPNARFFEDYTTTSGVAYQHQEIPYDDYEREILLPHRYSQQGPFISVGDVNADELDDFFIGGGAEQSGQLYLQDKKGTFQPLENQPWELHKNQEDMGSALIDINGDEHLDLYVVSGSNQWEENAKEYQDRIYINDGLGNFKYDTTRLPQNHISGARISTVDFDKDGDMDIFVGGRVRPGKYPMNPKSMLLINESGKFIDKTKEIAPDIEEIGMVTQAIWTDYDQDDDVDLIVVGEWMPITIFKNEGGKLQNITPQTTLHDHIGWWYSIASGDFDKDGDIDFVAGNLGLNSKYQIKEGPLEVYAGDLDHNKTHDIILGYASEGKTFPVRGKSCSSEQIPSINIKIPTYELFGDATLKDVYGASLDTAFRKEVNWLQSSYIENLGNDHFEIKPLPNFAQFSPINAILPTDINDDGNLDLITGGNMYAAETETVRHDASFGLIVLGDGKGKFNPIELDTGLIADGDLKDMKFITTANDTKLLLIGKNNENLEILKIIGGK